MIIDTTRDEQDPDLRNGIGRIAHGDDTSRRELRANLAVAARRTDDAELSALIRDVLRGDRDVMDVFNHPTFNAMAQHSLDNAVKGLEQLDDDARAEVMDPTRPPTPDAEIAAMRDAATPGAEAAIRSEAEQRDPALRHLRP